VIGEEFAVDVGLGLDGAQVLACFDVLALKELRGQ